jgi:hypothetical protein
MEREFKRVRFSEVALVTFALLEETAPDDEDAAKEPCILRTVPAWMELRLGEAPRLRLGEAPVDPPDLCLL